MKVNCSHTKLVPLSELKPNPKNPNQHSEDQIILLSKILQATGWRSPIVVSNQSGFIVKGHGRLEASKLAGFASVPVDFQNYASEEEEISDLIADNRLSELSDFDGQQLKDLIEELDTGDNDLDLTGYDQPNLEMLMSQFHVDDGTDVDEKAEYDGMPEIGENEDSFRKIIVHFDSDEAVREFALKLACSKITEKTKSMWYPWKDRESSPDFE
jgi:hypothetical protein